MLTGKNNVEHYVSDFPVVKEDRDGLRGILLGMYRRCYVPSTIGFHRWGGRGIRISPEWYDEVKHKLHYRNFFLWAIASGYKDKLQIDRIDNDANYRTFLHRYAMGWTLEEIFSTPLKSVHDKRIRRKGRR